MSLTTTRPQASQKSGVASNGAHLLVVDDDKRIRTLLARFLLREGYFVSTAANVAEATARLRDLAFDLIILDVMMPGESGTAFAARLRGGRGTFAFDANPDADRASRNAEPSRRARGRRRRLPRQALRSARIIVAHRQHSAPRRAVSSPLIRPRASARSLSIRRAAS